MAVLSKSSRARLASEVSPDEVVRDGRSIPSPTPGWRSPYAPKPAQREPEVTDYTQGGLSRPSIYDRTAQRDMTGIPAKVRHDQVKLQWVLAAQRVSAAPGSSPDGRTWSQIANGADLAELRAEFGMDDEPYVHQARFISPTGRRHSAPDNERVDNVFYRRGR